MTAKNIPDLSSYFDLLGRRIRDKVSGQEGVCEVLTFDLYGCIQIAIAPPIDKDGKFIDGRMLDVHRVQVIDADTRVVPCAAFPNYVATFEMLGKRARDRISGMIGTISSVSFDYDGVVRAAISPPVDKDGKPLDGRWMPVSRIEVIGAEQVMPVPSFTTAPPAYGATPQQHTHGPSDTPPPSATSISVA